MNPLEEVHYRFESYDVYYLLKSSGTVRKGVPGNRYFKDMFFWAMTYRGRTALLSMITIHQSCGTILESELDQMSAIFPK